MEACASFDSCGCTWDTFQFCNFNAFAENINDVLCCKFCTENVVGSNLTSDVNAVYCTVNGDNVNAFSHSCFNSACYSVRVNRVDDENGNACCNKVFHIGNLFCNIVASVSNCKCNTKFVSCSLCTFNKCYEEWVVLCGNCKADGAVAHYFNFCRSTEAVCIVFVYKCNFNRDGSRDFFASYKFNCVVNSCGADECRLLCDCTCHFACFDSFDSIVCCVKTNNHNLFASAADSFNCAQSHFVVCCEYSLNIAVSLKDVFHYGHTFCSVKVSCLFCNYIEFCVSNIVETCASVDSCGCTRDTFKFCNLNAFAESVNDVLCSKFCTENVVGSNLTCNFNAVYCAVNGNYLNTFSHSCFNCACNSVRVNRVNDENGNAFCNKVFNVGSLFCNIVACICNAEFNAKFCSLCLCTFNECYEERVVLCGNGKTDCTACRSTCLAKIFFAVNCNHTACHGQDHSKAENQ